MVVLRMAGSNDVPSGYMFLGVIQYTVVVLRLPNEEQFANKKIRILISVDKYCYMIVDTLRWLQNIMSRIVIRITTDIHDILCKW